MGGADGDYVLGMELLCSHSFWKAISKCQAGLAVEQDVLIEEKRICFSSDYFIKMIKLVK